MIDNILDKNKQIINDSSLSDINQTMSSINKQLHIPILDEINSLIRLLNRISFQLSPYIYQSIKFFNEIENRLSIAIKRNNKEINQFLKTISALQIQVKFVEEKSALYLAKFISTLASTSYISDINVNTEKSEYLTPIEQEAVLDILKGKEVSYLSWESLKKVSQYIWAVITFLSVICSLTGTNILQLFESDLSEVSRIEKLEMLCGKLPKLATLPQEVRETHLSSGSLLMRKYDNKKSEVLYRLENGERFCVITSPKENAQWLKIAVKNADGETLTGYVMRKYTKKVYDTFNN
ncbi:hypothetical protein [Gallibacterium sp. ZY190522]